MCVCVYLNVFISRIENKELLMKKEREKEINMISSSLLLIFYILFIHADENCFQQSNEINYLFVNDMSQIKIPLLPLDCRYCQSAYQVDIQLIDEQLYLNRTIQRIKIFLKNFEIEDSSYICLRHLCPILVEYGSDSMLLNITSALFSHVFLSLTYSKNNSVTCSIQTRFAIFSFNNSFTCTPEIYLHPQWNIQIIGQLTISDCRAYLFEENIYQTSIQFHPINNRQIMMKSSEKSCEYIFEHTHNLSSIPSKELSTRITIYPFYNPWKKEIQTLGPCRTKIIPYREMVLTEEIVNIRNIYTKQGQTIQIQCPIDGSEKYLKYIWYYQRYQPKYQISNNRTIILKNLTKQMQGKYMCIADDGNEKLEFEMSLHITNHKNNSFYAIIILILLVLLIFFCFILTLIIYFSFQKSPQINSSMAKPNSFTIHHNVMLTIQQQSPTSLWNEDPYHTLDYIDEQPIYQIPSWLAQSYSEINPKQIPHRFSTRHRNINGQLAVNIPFLQSNNDLTFSPIVKFNERHDEMEILKISVPLLNQYPLIKSSNSIISFDSQNELNEFNQMTYVCMDQASFLDNRQSSNHLY